MVIAVDPRAGMGDGGSSGSVARLLALGVVPAGTFATIPGSPRTAVTRCRAACRADRPGWSPDARMWADWGTQRVLPAYQNGPFGDLRW